MPLRHRRDDSPFLPSRAPLLESCGRGSPTRFTSPLQSQLLTASGMRSDVVPIITTLPPCLDPEFSLWGKRGSSAPVHSVTDQTHRLISHRDETLTSPHSSMLSCVGACSVIIRSHLANLHVPRKILREHQ
jgi:hypothetical protein